MGQAQTPQAIQPLTIALVYHSSANQKLLTTMYE